MISTELKKKVYFYIISSQKDSWVRLTLLRFYIHAFPVLLLVNRMKLKMLLFELQEYLLYSGVSNSLWKYIYIKSLEMSLCKIGHANISLFFGQTTITAGRCNRFAWNYAALIWQKRHDLFCYILLEDTFKYFKIKKKSYYLLNSINSQKHRSKRTKNSNSSSLDCKKILYDIIKRRS